MSEFSSGQVSALSTPVDFLSIAKEALSRGFPITPLNPTTKVPALFRWNRSPITTITNAMQCAIEYPHHNVGVVGRHGIGNLIIWDVDRPGVEERMLRETGRLFPTTYVAQSRPKTKPFKRHIYFFQTEYSVSRLRKETNVKDLTTTENGKHPTLYDLKGCGGGGQVAAAGSMHDTGEKYEIQIEAPVIPIPNWLVDWFCADVKNYASAKRKAAAARRKSAQEAEKQTGQFNPSLESDDVFPLIRSRAGSFASLGVDRKDIEQLLLKQVAKFCQNGEELISRERIQQLAHDAAFNPRLRMGNAPRFGSESFGLTLSGPEPSRHSKLVRLISSFPSILSSDDAEQRVRDIWPQYNKQEVTHRNALYRARKVCGFIVEKKHDDRWIRQWEKA